MAFSLSKYKDRTKFFLEDSQTKAEVAAQKALKLYEKDKVHILVGPIGGHESAAVSAVLTPKKKLLIEAFGANAYLVGKDCNPYTFMLGHTSYNVSAPMAPWFLKNLGNKVFLVGVDYRTGREVALYFKEAFEKIGGKGQVLDSCLPLHLNGISMTFSSIIANLLYGITIGSAYTLIASGLSIIFGGMGVLNFAYGSFVMLGAYTGFAIVRLTGNF